MKRFGKMAETFKQAVEDAKGVTLICAPNQRLCEDAIDRICKALDDENVPYKRLGRFEVRAGDLTFRATDPGNSDKLRGFDYSLNANLYPYDLYTSKQIQNMLEAWSYSQSGEKPDA